MVKKIEKGPESAAPKTNKMARSQGKTLKTAKEMDDMKSAAPQHKGNQEAGSKGDMPATDPVSMPVKEPCKEKLD